MDNGHMYVKEDGLLYINAVGNPQKSGLNFVDRLLTYQQFTKYFFGEKFDAKDRDLYSKFIENYNFFIHF